MPTAQQKHRKALKRKDKLNRRAKYEASLSNHHIRREALEKAEEIIKDTKHPMYEKAQQIKAFVLGSQAMRKQQRNERRERAKILKPYKLVKVQRAYDEVNQKIKQHDRESEAFKELDVKRLKLHKKLEDHKKFSAKYEG